MQVKGIAEKSILQYILLQGEHSAILSTLIKLPIVIKIFVLSIFGWQFYAGFTVQCEREGKLFYFILEANKI